MDNTAKNFVLQLGALVSLYVLLSALITVVFGLINIAIPDAAEGYYAYESAQNGVRFGIAMLIVFLPTYLVLTRAVNNIRRNERGVYLTLTKWLIYLSLFVGGVILLGDLVAVIWSFLNGELTTRFLLKALTMLVVIGAAVGYYILDARNYWNTHEMYSKLCGLIAALVGIVVIGAGFFSIDTPNEVREKRIDEQQVQDLQDIQHHVENHYQQNGELPEEIDGLYTATNMPTASEERNAYQYRITDNQTYELCAEFAFPSERTESASYVRPPTRDEYPAYNYNWEHDAGDVCFTRTVSTLEVAE